MLFMIIIQKFLDETPTVKALYEYNTLDEAKSALYSTMASSMANDNIKSVLCEIINDIGGVVKHERWERNLVTENVQ